VSEARLPGLHMPAPAKNRISAAFRPVNRIWARPATAVDGSGVFSIIKARQPGFSARFVLTG